MRQNDQYIESVIISCPRQLSLARDSPQRCAGSSGQRRVPENALERRCSRVGARPRGAETAIDSPLLTITKTNTGIAVLLRR